MRDFAEHLIAYETPQSSGKPAAFPAVETLRPKLTSLLGNTGFHALLSRALARAAQEVPSLRTVQLKADGSLEPDAQVDPREFAEGRVSLLAHLLELLVAFIGEALTLRLMREVWPKLPVNDWIPLGDTHEQAQ
jgi:hypothetical protein